ncbi:MAG: hypothetical protein OEV42_20055 [Deltaproteobacteria bacterium]|nr:hypothetical protein [Deltaproteobacteria bacterium]
MTLLSAPRIFVSGLFPPGYIFPTFFLLTLLAATVTAWSHCGGMKGAFPPAREIIRGLLLSFVLLILLFPLKVFWFNPFFYSAIAETGNTQELRLIFPETFMPAIALTLWVVGFETLFFQAAAMSFFAKLTKQPGAAILLSTLLRFYVTWLRLVDMGVKNGEALIISHALLMNIISCLLFMRYGLLPPMFFIGGLSIYRWVFLWV